MALEPADGAEMELELELLKTGESICCTALPRRLTASPCVWRVEPRAATDCLLRLHMHKHTRLLERVGGREREREVMVMRTEVMVMVILLNAPLFSLDSTDIPQTISYSMSYTARPLVFSFTLWH